MREGSVAVWRSPAPFAAPTDLRDVLPVGAVSGDVVAAARRVVAGWGDVEVARMIFGDPA